MLGEILPLLLNFAPDIAEKAVAPALSSFLKRLPEKFKDFKGHVETSTEGVTGSAHMIDVQVGSGLHDDSLLCVR